MLRKGELNKNAVHTWVIVGLGDRLEDMRLRNRFREVDDVAQDICLSTSQLYRLITPGSPLYLIGGLQFHANISACTVLASLS